MGLKLLKICILRFLTSSCTSPKKKLRVAIASNLQYKLEAISKDFEKKHHCKVDIITASSGKLAAQIAQNAPFDVFCAADTVYPHYLQDNFFPNQKPYIFTNGELILWSKASFDSSKKLSVLKEKNIQKIAIANPSHAPLGKASVEALENAGLLEKIKEKLVFGESIAQVNQWVESGAVQIGLTERSVCKTKGGCFYSIPQGFYTPIKQSVIVLKPSKEAILFSNCIRKELK